MVEGARLESVYAGNRIAGSNPAPSAIIQKWKLTEPLPQGLRADLIFHELWKYYDCAQ